MPPNTFLPGTGFSGWLYIEHEQRRIRASALEHNLVTIESIIVLVHVKIEADKELAFVPLFVNLKHEPVKI